MGLSPGCSPYSLSLSSPPSPWNTPPPILGSSLPDGCEDFTLGSCNTEQDELIEKYTGIPDTPSYRRIASTVGLLSWRQTDSLHPPPVRIYSYSLVVRSMPSTSCSIRGVSPVSCMIVRTCSVSHTVGLNYPPYSHVPCSEGTPSCWIGSLCETLFSLNISFPRCKVLGL